MNNEENPSLEAKNYFSTKHFLCKVRVLSSKDIRIEESRYNEHQPYIFGVERFVLVTLVYRFIFVT